MSAIIYQITNLVNGKIYIGKTTKSLEERFKRHFYNHTSLNTHLYKSMRKHGFTNFSIELLEVADQSIINDRECYWISKLNPHYNMTKGGDGGDTSSSINYKLGMSKRNVSGANNSMYGRKRPDSIQYLQQGRDIMIMANRCPVVCEGIEYPSVGAAQEAYPGCNIRKRLDNPKYPQFYRLRERTKRK